jgi:hypothetical protein
MRTIEKLSLVALCLFLSLALSPARSVGQAVYGSIFGTVTDANGAAVPGAKVTITEVSKNVSVETETNSDGNYNQTRLIPGTYRVRVEATGFKASVIEAVNVSVDTASPANVALQAGAVSDEVTVTAEAPLLKTDRADVATTFESKQVTELPILDRNYTKFLLLTPGTQQLGWQHASSENPQGSVQIIVNGQPFHGTSFQLDGTDNRDPILGIIVINPTLESVSETKITSQNYDAEFGVATAGVATAQTKSGSNEYHGAAFIFRRNDVTSARNPFSQATADPLTGKFIPDTLWNQFGGALGGRIIRDKLFFFGDYQGTRRKTGGSLLTSVPTAAARTGDLREYGVNIYDPRTGSADGTGRTQFSNNGVLNVIPTARLNASALRLLNQLPLPTRPGVVNNFVASITEGFDSDQWNTREDVYLSERLHLFGRYSYARFDKTSPGAFGELLGGPSTVGFAGQSKVRNDSVAAGFDYTLSQSILTDFRFGWFRYQVNVLPNGFGTRPAADAGIPGLNLDSTFTSGMPAFYINGTGGFNFGYSLGVNQCNCPLDQNEKQVQFVNNWSFLSGNHNYKFGADVRHARNLRVPSDSHRAGELRFNNERTSNAGSQGLGLASFLLGDVSEFDRYVSSSTDARERQNRLFFYGQDTWRATQKLTVNYGLRWELIYPETVNAAGNGGWLDLTTGQIRVGGVGSVDRAGNVEMNYKHFAPRLGVAYQWDDKTVIRMGYGRSFDIGVFGSTFGHSVTQNLPVLAAQSLRPSANYRTVFNLTTAGTDPSGAVLGGAPTFTNFFGLNKLPKDPTAVANTSLPSNGLLFLPNGVFARARPEKMKLPTLDAWNLTIQRQLTNTLSVDAAYVGNKGTNTFTGFGPAFNVNQPTLRGYLNAQGQVTSTDSRRPYFPLFGWTQGIDFFGNAASSNYHALQTKVNQRFAQGFTILAHYTWSKAMNYDGDYFIHDAKLNYGPADTDRTHTFLAATTWELPFGKGKPFLGGVSRPAEFLVGGWQINQITTWSSGLPFNVGYRDCGADRDTGPCRPDRIADVEIIGRRDQWYAASSVVGLANGQSSGPWRRPARGTFGTLTRNALRGPSYFNTDLSLFKKFNFTETVNLEFRSEIFNLFNKVNLGQPNGCIDCPNAIDRGAITGLAGGATMRQVQFALRLAF